MPGKTFDINIRTRGNPSGARQVERALDDVHAGTRRVEGGFDQLEEEATKDAVRIRQELERLEKNLNQGVTPGLKKGTTGTKRFSMAMLEAGRAVEDAQYGFRGVANNLPQLALAAGLGGGAAGAVAILTTGIYQLVQQYNAGTFEGTKFGQMLDSVSESLGLQTTKTEAYTKALGSYVTNEEAAADRAEKFRDALSDQLDELVKLNEEIEHRLELAKKLDELENVTRSPGTQSAIDDINARDDLTDAQKKERIAEIENTESEIGRRQRTEERARQAEAAREANEAARRRRDEVEGDISSTEDRLGGLNARTSTEALIREQNEQLAELTAELEEARANRNAMTGTVNPVPDVRAREAAEAAIPGLEKSIEATAKSIENLEGKLDTLPTGDPEEERARLDALKDAQKEATEAYREANENLRRLIESLTLDQQIDDTKTANEQAARTEEAARARDAEIEKEIEASNAAIGPATDGVSKALGDVTRENVNAMTSLRSSVSELATEVAEQRAANEALRAEIETLRSQNANR